MARILTIVFFTAVIIFSVHPAAAEEMSAGSTNENITLDQALDWLRGEELPEKLRETPITVPLAKPRVRIENTNYGDPKTQINAITHIFRQYNKKLDNETAREYANIIKSTSEKFGEDPFVIAALIVIESTVKRDARSKGGDYGLMQVRWRVHKNRLMKKYPTMKTEKDMFKPRENIIAGTEIFSSYRESANGDMVIAMTAYSGGNPSHWNKVNNVVLQIKDKYSELIGI
ncbi:MAG: lytic transglycosylase domain-containing protein [Synergistaceae bacterium]|nr:lytic transglycosylase domain-containing protein [Synergistaceae bacterium]